MPTDPLQLTLAALEFTLVFGGAGLLLWLLGNRAQRTRWLGTHSLPHIPMSLSEFALAAVAIKLTEFVFGAFTQATTRSPLAGVQDQVGLQIIVLNTATYAGAFVAWRWLLPAMLRMWQVGPGLPKARSTRQTLSWSEATGYGVGTVLVALPLIILISLGWMELLRACGLPDEQQDLILLFTQTKSALVVGGMLVVACVLAPIYEELLFRAGLYRFVRQKLGRTPALLISGVCFGAMHLNWAGFVPLAVLGMLLALVYEVTGSIRVAIIAHGLFNLNTIIILLSGLSEVKP